jgi:hypothetical protein
MTAQRPAPDDGAYGGLQELDDVGCSQPDTMADVVDAPGDATASSDSAACAGGRIGVLAAALAPRHTHPLVQCGLA